MGVELTKTMIRQLMDIVVIPQMRDLKRRAKFKRIANLQTSARGLLREALQNGVLSLAECKPYLKKLRVYKAGR